MDYYGEGVYAFYRKLRSVLGDKKLILADGNETSQQRAFGILNGIESEGFPFANDFNLDAWSSGINRNLFWDQHARDPKMNYINLKWGEELAGSGRVLLRPSGTEPLVRVMVEAPTHEQATAIAGRIAAVVTDRLALG